jgi:hypothetical protein
MRIKSSTTDLRYWISLCPEIYSENFCLKHILFIKVLACLSKMQLILRLPDPGDCNLFHNHTAASYICSTIYQTGGRMNSVTYRMYMRFMMLGKLKYMQQLSASQEKLCPMVLITSS